MSIITQQNEDIINGTIVEFDNTSFSGKAKIVGIANTENAVIGKSYIVECIDNQFPSEVYPYPCFILFECFITKII